MALTMQYTTRRATRRTTRRRGPHLRNVFEQILMLLVARRLVRRVVRLGFRSYEIETIRRCDFVDRYARKCLYIHEMLWFRCYLLRVVRLQ